MILPSCFSQACELRCGAVPCQRHILVGLLRLDFAKKSSWIYLTLDIYRHVLFGPQILNDCNT